MKTVAFHNLGCKVNDYETDIMQQLFTENGFRVVGFNEKADVYVVNTCTVTNIADRKSRQMLHRAKKLNPDAVVIAVGCYVQTAGEKVLKDESIDIAIGNNKKSEIINILNEYLKDNGSDPHAGIIDINKTSEYESMFLTDTAERTRAYIKIQDGCDQFCSYCLIPYARGRARSRDEADILEEIKGLAAKGYREFVLTGIHVSSYGVDRIVNDGKKAEFNTMGREWTNEYLIGLLKAMESIDGVERIRLSSLEPRIVTEEFARRISEISKLCPHFHLSLQSGSNETLKRMNRHYTADEYLRGVELLRKYFDDPAITTDIIVGFPGESDRDFKESFEFARKVSFYEMHIFKFSKRNGTAAAKMPDQVADGVKEERSHIMIGLRDELSREFRRSYIGKVRPVLFEEELKVGRETFMVGFTPEYIKVATPLRDAAKNGIYEVTIEDFLDDEVMKGTVV